MKAQNLQKRDDSNNKNDDSARKTTRTMTEKQQARHEAVDILAIGGVSDVEVHAVDQKETIVEKNNPVTSEKTTAETTTTTMYMMNSLIRSQQARHEANRKFTLGVVSYVDVPGVLLNDQMNIFKVPSVVLKKNTSGGENKTCDVEVPEAG